MSVCPTQTKLIWGIIVAAITVGTLATESVAVAKTMAITGTIPFTIIIILRRTEPVPVSPFAGPTEAPWGRLGADRERYAPCGQRHVPFVTALASALN